MDLNELRVMLHKVVPDEDIAFIGSFEDRVEIGDYLFVHAGVRPGLFETRRSATCLPSSTRTLHR